MRLGKSPLKRPQLWNRHRPCVGLVEHRYGHTDVATGLLLLCQEDQPERPLVDGRWDLLRMVGGAGNGGDKLVERRATWRSLNAFGQQKLG